MYTYIYTTHSFTSRPGSSLSLIIIIIIKLQATTTCDSDNDCDDDNEPGHTTPHNSGHVRPGLSSSSIAMLPSHRQSQLPIQYRQIKHAQINGGVVVPYEHATALSQPALSFSKQIKGGAEDAPRNRRNTHGGFAGALDEEIDQ